MENYQPQANQVQMPVGQLKESTRDMAQLQRDYRVSDELFWEIFNARVLLNEQIDVNAFVNSLNIPSIRA